MINPSQFLRRAILGDAIFSGASAVLLTVGAGMLAPSLSLPEALLRETGLFLIAYAMLVGWLGTRQSMPKALVITVISGNAAWTFASIALLFSGAVTPNLLGEAFVAIQAIAVGAIAELQYIGISACAEAAGCWRPEAVIASASEAIHRGMASWIASSSLVELRRTSCSAR